jgi:hypothetical protein
MKRNARKVYTVTQSCFIANAFNFTVFRVAVRFSFLIGGLYFKKRSFVRITTIVLDITTFNRVEVCRRFGGAYCDNLQGEKVNEASRKHVADCKNQQRTLVTAKSGYLENGSKFDEIDIAKTERKVFRIRRKGL